jgi:DNA end-binding protein Ku
MLEIAETIIEQHSGQFDPARFVDRYEEALREVMERKMKGRPIKVLLPKLAKRTWSISWTP